MKRFLLILLLTFPVFANLKAETKTISTTYTHYASKHATLEQAKLEAVERAKIDILAKEFGVAMSSTTALISQEIGGQTSDQLQSLSVSDVNGEWLQTIGEPKFEIAYITEFGLVIKVTITGKIREREKAEVQFVAKVLRNGTDARFEATEFRNEDALYLQFQSPVDGYLIVYLTDNDNAYCLLPYQRQKESVQYIEKDKIYTFFSQEMAPKSQKNLVDEYQLTCGETMEINRLHIIFSTNKFAKAADQSAATNGTPRQLTAKDFATWLGTLRHQDKELSVQIVDIVIRL